MTEVGVSVVLTRVSVVLCGGVLGTCAHLVASDVSGIANRLAKESDQFRWGAKKLNTMEWLKKHLPWIAAVSHASSRRWWGRSAPATARPLSWLACVVTDIENAKSLPHLCFYHCPRCATHVQLLIILLVVWLRFF